MWVVYNAINAPSPNYHNKFTAGTFTHPSHGVVDDIVLPTNETYNDRFSVGLSNRYEIIIVFNPKIFSIWLVVWNI